MSLAIRIIPILGYTHAFAIHASLYYISQAILIVNTGVMRRFHGSQCSQIRLFAHMPRGDRVRGGYATHSKFLKSYTTPCIAGRKFNLCVENAFNKTIIGTFRKILIKHVKKS